MKGRESADYCFPELLVSLLSLFRRKLDLRDHHATWLSCVPLPLGPELASIVGSSGLDLSNGPNTVDVSSLT
jgi:hypothetical protein